MTTLIEDQANVEAARFALLEQRDGREAALEWARRTLNAYREAAANPHHFASTREYRVIFEASIRALQALLDRHAPSEAPAPGEEGGGHGPGHPVSLDEVKHETAEAARALDSIAGEEDPGAAAEVIARLIAEHERSAPPKKR